MERRHAAFPIFGSDRTSRRVDRAGTPSPRWDGAGFKKSSWRGPRKTGAQRLSDALGPGRAKREKHGQGGAQGLLMRARRSRASSTTLQWIHKAFPMLCGLCGPWWMCRWKNIWVRLKKSTSPSPAWCWPVLTSKPGSTGKVAMVFGLRPPGRPCAAEPLQWAVKAAAAVVDT